jgi:ribosome recycling factor
MEKTAFISELKTRMDKAMSILDHEFKGLRTGRASINLLDPVMVEAYGSRMPLNQVATVSTPDARTIAVQVWDKGMVKAVEKGIADANLGVNPASDGQVVRMSIPLLTEDRRKELAKLCGKYGENVKIAVRNVRRDGMDNLKKLEKDAVIGEDEHHKISDEVQKLTDDFVAKIDAQVKQKEQEILTV